MLRRRACLIALLSLPCLSKALPPELGGMHLQGQAQMRFFGFPIYEIRLWVHHGSRVDAENWPKQDLALELVYARSLSGKDIASRSLVEMRRQGPIADEQAKAWLAAMESAFPDVNAGDRISGILEPGRGAQFYVNGQPGQHIADTEFARFFFGIWLSAQTSEPGLRARLLEGGSDAGP